jgi:hypothetical protein
VHSLNVAMKSLHSSSKEYSLPQDILNNASGSTQVAIFVFFEVAFFLRKECEVIKYVFDVCPKEMLCRSSLSLLSIAMGNFFPTVGEVGISFHNNHVNVLAMR